MKTLRKQPAYRHHKARDCAVVTLNGKNHYLGPWQSPESHEHYAWVNLIIADPAITTGLGRTG